MSAILTIDPTLVVSLAPTGVLRTVINLGNPALARMRPGPEQQVAGVSIDIAQDLAHRLGVEARLMVVDNARQAVEAVGSLEADLGFFTLDSCQDQPIATSAPYLLIEGCYLVRQESPIRNNEDVDQAHHKVVVSQGSAYEQFLGKSLEYAQLVRASTSLDAIANMLDSGADAVVGIRQTSWNDSPHKDRLRQLDGCFMVLQQVLGISEEAGADAARFLAAYTEHLKQSGFIQARLDEHGIAGATVAPLRTPED